MKVINITHHIRPEMHILCALFKFTFHILVFFCGNDFTEFYVLVLVNNSLRPDWVMHFVFQRTFQRSDMNFLQCFYLFKFVHICLQPVNYLVLLLINYIICLTTAPSALCILVILIWPFYLINMWIALIYIVLEMDTSCVPIF